MNKSVTVQLCEQIECEECPVFIHNYETRTEYEKTVLHEPCCTNLYKWIIEQISNDKKAIEQILKQHNAYVFASIEGKGCHVGRFQKIGLDADGNFVIEVDIDSQSSTC